MAGGRTMTVTVAVPLRTPSFAVNVSVANVDSVTLGAVQLPVSDVGALNRPPMSEVQA